MKKSTFSWVIVFIFALLASGLIWALCIKLTLPRLMGVEFLVPHLEFLPETVDHPLLRLSASPPPTIVDLYSPISKSIIPVDDQGQYGSCTAHAMRYAWSLMKYYESPLVRAQPPSRAYWYAMSRQRLGDNLQNDYGSTNAATVWALANKGQLPESLYPYTAQNITHVPPTATITAAAPGKRTLVSPYGAFVFSSNTGITQNALIAALAAKRCIIVGIAVYSSFQSHSVLTSGIIPLPNTRTEQFLGGHAICISGYNTMTQRFSFRNSWGTTYGVGGTFTIPFAYITNTSLTFDAWVL